MLSFGDNDLSDKAKREDITFIVCFNWKSPDHLKEAMQIYESSRLDEGNDYMSKSGRISKSRSTHLDANEMFAVRLAIASNPNTPASVLDYLAKTSMRFPTLLERIADNPNASRLILRQLACHPALSVRAVVAENPSAPYEAQEILVTDDDVDIRYRLAENPHVPITILELLVEDSNPYVVERARRTLNRLTGANILEAKFPDVSNTIAKRRIFGAN
jgi:hypothetical protein